MESNRITQTVLGIDIGGSKVCLALVSDQGDILHSVRYPGEYTDLDGFTSKLYNHIDVFLAKWCTARRPAGIGIGIKALVDYKRQRLFSSSLLGALVPYDFCSELYKRYGIPAVIDNDVKAATLAELKFGAGRLADNFSFINIGTGTAVGIVTDGRLLRGKTNDAGEMGSTFFERVCSEEVFFTLESVASGKGAADEAVRLTDKYPQSCLGERIQSGEKISGFDVFKSYGERDKLAEGSVRSFLRVLALGIFNLEMIVNSRLYVFGGGVVTGCGWLLPELRNEIEHICKKLSHSWVAEFRTSELGADDVGVLGAASIALDAPV